MSICILSWQVPYGIDKDRDENRRRHLGSVLRIHVFEAAGELVMFRSVKQSDCAEDDDGKY
jgi:hypothetical protein